MGDRPNDLRQQMIRRWELKELLPTLESQKEKLEQELFALHIDRHNQRADVENLESRSIKNYFLRVSGKLDDRLEQERREARAAESKYNAAEEELDRTKRRLADCREEIQALSGCTLAYWDALSDAADQDRITECRQYIIKELETAAASCESTRAALEKLRTTLTNLIDRNVYGMGNINALMPSYLASVKKQLDLMKSQVDLLREQLADLPLREPILNLTEIDIDVDSHILDDLLSRDGRDKSLRQVRSAVKASEETIKRICDEIHIHIEKWSKP